MSVLYFCSGCCMVLSIWAIIQLAVMGVCYKLEAVSLLEDVDPHIGGYADYDDFIKSVKNNYAALAINCWIVAGIYVVTLALSCVGLRLIKKAEKKKALKKNDDEYYCTLKEGKKH